MSTNRPVPQAPSTSGWSRQSAGAGLGASHQTGWTGVITRLVHLFATTTAEDVLAAKPRVEVSAKAASGA